MSEQVSNNNHWPGMTATEAVEFESLSDVAKEIRLLRLIIQDYVTLLYNKPMFFEKL
jgi:hypothetical protein